MPPTPADLRTQLLDLIRLDLLGPANGPDEIVDEPNGVRGRYMLGVLAPLGQPSLLQPEEELGEDQTDLDDAPLDDDDDSPVDFAPKRANGMMPTSIGLTFTVGGDVYALVRLAAHADSGHRNANQVGSQPRFNPHPKHMHIDTWRSGPATGTESCAVRGVDPVRYSAVCCGRCRFPTGGTAGVQPRTMGSEVRDGRVGVGML